MTKSELLEISKLINAPLHKVWQAWTEPDQLAQWFTAESGLPTKVIEMDVREGGKVRLMFPGAAGEYTWTYVTIKKPRLLVFDILDFSFSEYPEGNGGTCNVKLDDLDGKTRVTVWGDLSNEAMREMAVAGWSGTLTRLNNYLKG